MLLCVCLVTQSCLTFSHQTSLSMEFPRQGAGCHFLLQGISPTQGLNPPLLHLLHWQVVSSPLCYLGIPRVHLWRSCCRLNCVPCPQMICWSPNPFYHKMSPYLGLGSLQVSLVRMRSSWSRAGSLSHVTGILIRGRPCGDGGLEWWSSSIHTLLGERPGTNSPLKLSEGTKTTTHTLLSDIWPPELWDNQSLFFKPPTVWRFVAAAAKSLPSCPTLCDPIDGSPPGSRIPGILQARTLEWVAISFSNVWKWKVKVKSLSRVWPSVTPWTGAYQAPPFMGFSRQEYWSGVPLPSPTEALVEQKTSRLLFGLGARSHVNLKLYKPVNNKIKYLIVVVPLGNRKTMGCMNLPPNWRPELRRTGVG